ncbi:MAG TPA: rod shape-determining protein MreC, partial [Burkholderiales bacterium]|nr:rod shape-determining protein MreC [Burkholderiales bacterium]
MDHSPPPFFKRGPAPLVRLFFFASLSLALLVIDARFRYAEGLRTWLALAAYPLQRAATAPVDLLATLGGFFSTQAHLVEENERLRSKALMLSHDAQRYEAAQAEVEQLRKLVGVVERLEVRVIPAEVMYRGRDPYSHKLFVDRGSTHGVRPGSPVTDESGVIGQVTRVHPLLSEVTLATDRDQAIPVQVVRNGLRAVAFGGGVSGALELRFMAANADIQTNDRLVTSGIDGTYPPGLPVATVTRIEKDAENAFARVVCRPAAGVDRGRFVLVLTDETVRPPPPEEQKSSKNKTRG